MTQSIPDMNCIKKFEEEVKPRRRMRQKGNMGFLWLFLCSILIGVVVGVLYVFMKKKGGIKLPEKTAGVYLVLGLLWYVASTILQLFIHEAGHLVFGLLSGYRFLSFRVFSLTFVKKDGKIVIKKLKIPGTAGQCLMYPPKWDDRKKYPYALYNLGGGFLNLIAGAVFLPLCFLGNTGLSVAVGIFAFTGAVTGLSNIIPCTIGIPNDGKNFMWCKKSIDNRKAFYLQLAMNAEMSDGKQLLDYPVEHFRLSEQADLRNSLTGYLRLMEYYWHLLSDHMEEAERCLSSLEQQAKEIPVFILNVVDLERLALQVQRKASIEEIAALFAVTAPILRTNKSDPGIVRVKYTYALCLTEEEKEKIEWLCCVHNGKLPKKLPKQKPMDATEALKEAEQIKKKHPVTGEADYQMQLLYKVREDFTEKRNQKLY